MSITVKLFFATLLACAVFSQPRPQPGTMSPALIVAEHNSANLSPDERLAGRPGREVAVGEAKMLLALLAITVVWTASWVMRRRWRKVEILAAFARIEKLLPGARAALKCPQLSELKSLSPTDYQVFKEIAWRQLCALTDAEKEAGSLMEGGMPFSLWARSRLLKDLLRIERMVACSGRFIGIVRNKINNLRREREEPAVIRRGSLWTPPPSWQQLK